MNQASLKKKLRIDDMIESAAIVSFLGLALGSFMNSCAYRLPRNISLVRAKSFCPNCGEGISWLGLIPLLGYLLQKGHCEHCREKIPFRYPLIETLFAGLTISLFYAQGLNFDFVVTLIFAFLMILIALIDVRHFIIPNELIVAGLSTGILITGLNSTDSFINAMLSGFGAFVVMVIVRQAGDFLFKKESLGMGDVKLAGVVGLFIGFTPFLIALWGASIVGTMYGLAKQRSSNNNVVGYPTIRIPQSEIGKLPFGAFLSLSSLLVFIFKAEIITFMESWLTLSL